ncbi:MAG: ABC transporter permease, partial [Rhizobium sp.]|nr:ABC transporter permease [Rhizobium sp.]
MSIEASVVIEEPHVFKRMFRMLLADKFALCAAIFLLIILVMAVVGPSWLGDLATKQNLRGRNAAPFDF